MKKLIAAIFLLLSLACQNGTEEGVTYFSIRSQKHFSDEPVQFWFGISARLNEYVGEESVSFENVKGDAIKIAVKGHHTKEDLALLCLSNGDLMFAETVTAKESQAILVELGSMLGGDSLVLAKPDVSLESANANKGLSSTDQLLAQDRLTSEDSIIRAWAVFQKPFRTLIDFFDHQFLGDSSAAIGLVHLRDTAALNHILSLADEKGFLENIRFVYPSRAEDNSDYVYLYGIRYSSVEDDFVGLNGEYVKEAQVYSGGNNDHYIQVEFTEEGAHLWEKMTTDQKGRQIGILLDAKAWSVPRVSESIKDGYTAIRFGDLGLDQIRQFAILLNIRPLGYKGEILDYHYDPKALWSH